VGRGFATSVLECGLRMHHEENVQSGCFSRGSNASPLGDLFLTRHTRIPRKATRKFRVCSQFPCVGNPHARASPFHDQIRRACELTCVDPKHLAAEFVGREFDEQLPRICRQKRSLRRERGISHLSFYAVDVRAQPCRSKFVLYISIARRVCVCPT